MTDQTHFADDATLARIAALEAELVSYTLERTMRQHAEKTNDDLLAQLAASQARIKELREWQSRAAPLVQHSSDCLWNSPLPTGEGVFGCTCGASDLVLDGQPLHEPTDPDEALRKYVAGEMRKMGVSRMAREWACEYADRYEKGEV